MKEIRGGGKAGRRGGGGGRRGPHSTRKQEKIPPLPLHLDIIYHLSRSSKPPNISTMDASMARMFQQMMGGAMADVGIGGSDLSQVIIILFLCIRYAQISVSCER